jgi:hypothetical protein
MMAVLYYCRFVCGFVVFSKESKSDEENVSDQVLVSRHDIVCAYCTE